MDKQISLNVDYIDNGMTNSYELVSVLRLSNRWNIVYSACLLCEKDKLHYF